MKHEERRKNRTERLFALVLLLQGKKQLTTKDLADHFGVSRRTIFRDLRALSESGVPLTYGETGGYEILEGYQLPPLMLSAREAATLLIGIDFMKLQSDASLRQDADNVGLKIRTMLPGEVKSYVERLGKSVALDPYWTESVSADSDTQGRWFQLSEAVARQRTVVMKYFVESRGEVTQRQVDPLGLVYYTDHWNLIAHDHLRNTIRNFRLDRIREMHVLTEKFDPPEGFDLDSYLLDKLGLEERQEVAIWFADRVVDRARRSIPARILEEKKMERGTEFSFTFENMPYLAKWVVRFGADAEIKKPAQLIDEMKAELERLDAIYK